MAKVYFEIYFEDLNSVAQKQFLKFLGISDPEEFNYDILPISLIHKSEVFGN